MGITRNRLVMESERCWDGQWSVLGSHRRSQWAMLPGKMSAEPRSCLLRHPASGAGLGREEASETRPSTRGALSRRPRPTDNRPAVLLPEAGSPTAPRGAPSAVPHPFPLCPLGTGSPWARTRLQPPSALAGEGAPSPRGGQSPNAQGLPDRRQLSLLPERPFQLLAETCSEATSEDKMRRGQGRPASGGTRGVMQSRVRHSRLLAVTQITFWHLWHRAPRRH